MTGHRKRELGFTIIELLLSMTVTAIVMVIAVEVISHTQNMVSQTNSRIEDFREARTAFEAISRRLSQATLNTYWDYQRDSSSNALTQYVRQSDLHFVCGPALGATGLLPNLPGTVSHAVFFQAPLGYTTPAASIHSAVPVSAALPDLLNGWGYFVVYGSDLPQRPAFLSTAQEQQRNPERKRFRLMEFRQSTDKLRVYELQQNPESVLSSKPPAPLASLQNSQAGLYSWFTQGYFSESVNPVTGDTLGANSEPLADNVIALFISPRAPGASWRNQSHTDYDIAPNYLYDSRAFQWNKDGGDLPVLSRHQLPPVIELTLVAVDERSWQTFEIQHPTGVEQIRGFLQKHFVEVGPAGSNLSPQDSEYESIFRKDLASLGSLLTSLGLNHREFSASFPLRAAKWSTDFLQ